ncbi:hypothetical protein ACIA2T_16245 [Amycolatopsis japonica]|uniref:hypothetical protein n=1 Tax=Amycolatopsis japonica TaxID=208439 RepID=UPI00379322AA
MVTLLTQPVHGLVGIDYKHFTIQSRGLAEPPRFPFDQPHNLTLPIRDALAIYVAGDYTAYALVHLEAWDSEPTAGAPAHSDTETQTVRFTVADIAAQGTMATAPDTGVLRLSAPGPHHVRVHRWGVEDVNHVFDANPNAITTAANASSCSSGRPTTATPYGTTNHPLSATTSNCIPRYGPGQPGTNPEPSPVPVDRTHSRPHRDVATPRPGRDS